MKTSLTRSTCFAYLHLDEDRNDNSILRAAFARDPDKQYVFLVRDVPAVVEGIDRINSDDTVSAGKTYHQWKREGIIEQYNTAEV